MTPEAQTNSQPPMQRRSVKHERGGLKAIIFLVIWIALISGGIYAAKLYAEQIKHDITEDVHTQTEAQIAAIHEDYTKQINELETEIKAEMTELQEQVQTFNELLTFANDNVKDETDNSNQLYSQLEEVKKQLQQLEKNLEVLK